MSHEALAVQEFVEQPETIYRNSFRIGGVSVQLTGSRYDDVAFASPLDRFQIDAGAPDIAIQVEWLQDLPMHPARQLFDSGYSWRLHEAGSAGFRFDFFVPLFGVLPFKRLLIGTDFSSARLQMNESCFAGVTRVPCPLEYPLDELLIMHRLTQEDAIELHGCGIVAEGAGNLFVGYSGAGKSTTTRLWNSRQDAEVLSDDRIIVREHSGQMFMYGTPWHGEAHFALAQRAPLKRIFVLEHGRGNVLTRLNCSQMVAELFARSFVPFYRHQYLDHALNFLERVADSVPCYRYSFEPDERAVERILNLRD